MKLAILSGKGGAGKTFVSVNLASTAPKATYIDCDIEEPNGAIYLKPDIRKTNDIKVSIPKIDKDKCDGCRICVDFCKFNALAYIQDSWILFDDICHSCGGCMLLCPQNALSEGYKSIGEIEFGCTENIEVLTGKLNIGEPSGVPIISELVDIAEQKSQDDPDNLLIFDCPPGSACTAMESIQSADYCLLVAEPTIFGTHNLEIVYNLVKIFNKPFGVVINKYFEEKNPAEDFCKKHNINIVGKIPFDKTLNFLNSKGEIAVLHDTAYAQLFSDILQSIYKEVPNETATYSKR